MQQSKYLYIFVISILCSAKLISSRPVPNEDAIAVHVHLPYEMQRAQRQIVQPTWLTDNSRPLLPIDGVVHINQKNLQEVAELRDAIQKAVNEGRFAVDIEQDQPPHAPPFNVEQQNAQLGPRPPLGPQPPLAPPPPPLPPATAPQLAPFNPAPWAFRQMALWPPVNPQQPNLMQRMWSDFMENTRRIWERN